MSHEVEWNQGLGKRFRPDGTYAYVARWSDRSGQKRTETFPDGTSYQTAKALRAERVRESRLGFAHGSETLDEFVRGSFWPLKERKVRPYTLYTMQRAYEGELKARFGRMRLRDIRASHVQAWVDASQYGSATLRKHLSLLSQVLKAASVRDLAQPVDFASLELPAIPGRDYILSISHTAVYYTLNPAVKREHKQKEREKRRRATLAARALRREEKQQEYQKLANATGGELADAYSLVRKAAQRIDRVKMEGDRRHHVSEALTKLHQAEDAIGRALKGAE